MNKPWKVVVAFVGVFVAGMVAGGPLLERWQSYRHEKRAPWVERTMHRYEQELDVTPAQKEKIWPILRETQKQWRQLNSENVRNLSAVIDQMHQAVAAELTDEQKPKLEEIRHEFRARARQLQSRTLDREDEKPSPRR